MSPLTLPSPLRGEGKSAPLSPVRGRGQGEGAGVEGPRNQIFQPAIQSISLAPAGFMPCLVETTSSGLTVTKS